MPLLPSLLSTHKPRTLPPEHIPTFLSPSSSTSFCCQNIQVSVIRHSTYLSPLFMFGTFTHFQTPQPEPSSTNTRLAPSSVLSFRKWQYKKGALKAPPLPRYSRDTWVAFLLPCLLRVNILPSTLREFNLRKHSETASHALQWVPKLLVRLLQSLKSGGENWFC